MSVKKILKLENIKPLAVLFAICIVVGALLSVVNSITAPIIEDRNNQAANAALLEVLPEGKDFKEIELTNEYPEVITKGYTADGGCVFQATVTGKSSGLIIMCGINSEGKIVGTKVIAEQETDSYDANVFPFVEGLDGKYKDMTLDSFDPYLVSGATLTSRAFSEAMKASLQAFAIANGEEVDTRTPEQILSDNLNAALGTTDVKFTKWFRTESLTGIDEVYESETGVGRVYVIGESFVGVNNSGEVVTADATADNKAAALAADAIIKASVLTKVTELPEGLPKRFVEAYVTATGNYVIVANGRGYGINGEWHNSGEFIKVQISISSEGKIIDTVTLYQSETPDVGGAALNNPDFVDSFNGKDNTDYTSVDAVTGATLTCNGYKDAIKTAFEAFELLTGGNQNDE